VKWRARQGAILERPKDSFEAGIQAEIRGHLRSLDEKGKRLFIEKHADLTALAALLLAPPYLSGLLDADVAFAKRKVDGHVDPEILKAMQDTAKAHTEAQAGWTRAIMLIAEGAGLTRDASGWRLPGEAA